MRVCDAIENKQLMTFTYDGYTRTVEPHTYGIDTKGHEALRAYQVSGGSESGEYTGWKLFHVDEICSLVIESNLFDEARPKYKRGDSAFDQIYCQL